MEEPCIEQRFTLEDSLYDRLNVLIETIRKEYEAISLYKTRTDCFAELLTRICRADTRDGIVNLILDKKHIPQVPEAMDASNITTHIPMVVHKEISDYAEQMNIPYQEMFYLLLLQILEEESPTMDEEEVY